MNSQFGFITKVFFFSAGLSVLIKYGGPLLPISPTTASAIIGVFLLPVVLVFVLGWRTSAASGAEALSQLSSQEQEKNP